LNSPKQKGKKPGDTLRDHESEHFELHASDLDSDEIEDLEECTDPSATRFPATDLVVNGVYKDKTHFRRPNSFKSSSNFNNTDHMSKGNYEKGKLPLN
jgi:hypothetical protein